jgi:hypothetical protein
MQLFFMIYQHQLIQLFLIIYQKYKNLLYQRKQLFPNIFQYKKDFKINTNNYFFII